MREIIVISMITLDGVMQAPGGPDEDTSGDFTYGGWVAPYSDEVYGKAMQKRMEPADILLGRKTFDIFAAYWPGREEGWPGINDVTKYVVSHTVRESHWKNSVFLEGVDDIKKLRNSSGGPIKVWGSGELVQLLFRHDLVDQLWLNIHPLTLGKGKNIFAGGVLPAAFILTENTITTSGVIMANYKRAGDVKTGTIGE